MTVGPKKMSRSNDSKISTNSEPVLSSTDDTALEERIVSRLSDMFKKSLFNVTTLPSENLRMQDQEQPPQQQRHYSSSSNQASLLSNNLQAPSTQYPVPQQQPPYLNSSTSNQEAPRSHLAAYNPAASYQQAYTTPPPALQSPPTLTEYPATPTSYQV